MPKVPKPPQAYQDFVEQYPKLGEAWDLIHAAGEDGPMDEKTMRLVKLGVAVGAMREGAIHSSVRKALAQGIAREEILQLIGLAAGTLGMPSTVAVFSWIRDHLCDEVPYDLSEQVQCRHHQEKSGQPRGA